MKTIDTRVIDRLISDVRQDLSFGNPFRYLLGRWDCRGKALVEAACSTYNAVLSRVDVISLSNAWDIYDSSCPKDHANNVDLVALAMVVDTLMSIGVSSVSIKGMFFLEYEFAREVTCLTEMQSYTCAFLQLRCAADDLKAEHEQKLDELLNAEIREHELFFDRNA
jgi:hypothetical protein